jgi:hypothetical protein
MQLIQPKLTNMAQNAPRTVNQAFVPPSGNAEGSMGFRGGFTAISASTLFSLGAMVEVLSVAAATCDGSVGLGACEALYDVGKTMFLMFFSPCEAVMIVTEIWY